MFEPKFHDPGAPNEVQQLDVAAKIEGGAAAVGAALAPHANHPRVIINFTALREIEAGSGMGLVAFFQRRGHAGLRTVACGIDPSVKTKYRMELFMFLEAREVRDTEAEALVRARE